MKTIVEFNQFKKAIEKVEKFNFKSENKVLENTHIIAKDGSLTLRRDNGDIQLNVSLDATIEELGNIVLLKSTSKLLKNIKKNSDMIIEDNLIKLGTKEIKFAEMLEEYPNINYELHEKKFEVSQKELLRLLSCSYCMAIDETRPILQGVNLKNNKCCAIDGYRMSVRESKEFTSDIDITIPSEAVKLLEKLLNDKSNGIVEVYTELGKNDKIKFTFEDIELIIKVHEEPYIKYEQLIRCIEDNKTIIAVNDNELKEKLSLITKAIDKPILKLDIKNNKVKFHSADAENSIKDNILCKDIKGNDLEIHFNCKYIIDAVKQYEDNFKMYFKRSIDPMIITNDYKNLELILPVRMVR